MSRRDGFDIRKLHPKSKKLCSCCSSVASVKVEIRVSWFRGDDEVYLACPEHASMVKAEKWDDFYYDYAMTKYLRATAA